MSKPEMHAFFDYPGPIPLAHRGGNEHYPENTMAAFQDAYDLGYRYFETDVHYTAGHELVAFHDKDLQRTLGLTGTIADITKRDRQTHLFDGKYQVPLLSELLTAFPDVYFHIDAKSPAAVEPLAATVQKLGAEGRVCLASFSAQSLRRLRALLPNVPTSTTQREIARLRYRWPTAAKPPAISNYLSIPVYAREKRGLLKLVTPRSVKKLHAQGAKVCVWTINDERTMNQLLDMGVDGIFTDKLSVLKRVLQARKQWIES